MCIPELLAPAGNMDKLRSALLYGANAAYLGGKTMNLRASAQGFTHTELVKAVKLAERFRAKIYYCLNSFPRQADLSLLGQEMEAAAKAGVHAFIVADAGVLAMARRLVPAMELHLSTQANLTNSAAAEFWHEQGVSRVNVARELPYSDILALREQCLGLELECFVHGAMCLAVSGQCLMSAWLNNRPANQGRCTQPCRFEYRAFDSEHLKLAEPEVERAFALEERLRPNEALWRIQEDDYHAVWAPDDLCLLPYLPWFAKHGIHALKIEGRMKSAAHVALVVDTYRSALNTLRSGKPLHVRPYMEELLQTSVRPLSSGFFLPGKRMNFTKIYGGKPQRPIVARVAGREGEDSWVVEVRDTWRAEAMVELILPGFRRPQLIKGSYALENHRGELHADLQCGTRGILRTSHPDIAPGIFIRAAA